MGGPNRPEFWRHQIRTRLLEWERTGFILGGGGGGGGGLSSHFAGRGRAVGKSLHLILCYLIICDTYKFGFNHTQQANQSQYSLCIIHNTHIHSIIQINAGKRTKVNIIISSSTYIYYDAHIYIYINAPLNRLGLTHEY